MRQGSRVELDGEAYPAPLDMLGTLLRPADIAAISARVLGRLPGKSRIGLAGGWFGSAPVGC
jgi:hypothetical protein